MVGTLNGFDGLHGLLQRLLVEGSLALCQQGRFVLFYLVGQVADDGLVRLQAAHQEGGGDTTEACGYILVAESLDGVGKVGLEVLDGSEIALIAEVHDAPEL